LKQRVVVDSQFFLPFVENFVKEPKQEKPEYETPPEHWKAVFKIRERLKSETPVSCKRVCVKPCGFGYGAGLGGKNNENVDPELRKEAFDLELRNVTAEEVRAVSLCLEGRSKK